jgi:hypothetical protein
VIYGAGAWWAVFREGALYLRATLKVEGWMPQVTDFLSQVNGAPPFDLILLPSQGEMFERSSAGTQAAAGNQAAAPATVQ